MRPLELLLAASLPLSAATAAAATAAAPAELGAPATSTATPIAKRLRWFVGSASATEKLLLHADVCTGILPCCNIASIYANGTFRAPHGNASAYGHWLDAGKTSRGGGP
jgi:hypothetical protein